MTVAAAALGQQVSTLTLSGDVKDLYTVTVDGQNVTYTTQPNDTLSDVRAGLTGAINAVATDVRAGAGATGEELVLTATSSGANAFQINSFTDHDQADPSATVLPDGRIVTTWQSYNQDEPHTNYYNVYGQLHTADGTLIGDEFQINTENEYNQRDPSVTALKNGDFIVTWESNYQDTTSSDYGVYGQRFGTDGAAKGDEFRINTRTSQEQSDPSIAALDDGGFIVVWQSYDQDPGNNVWGV